MWVDITNTDTWNLQSQATNQEARPEACQAYHLQYLDIQVDIQVEPPMIIQQNIPIKFQPSIQSVCQVKIQPKILPVCQIHLQVLSQSAYKLKSKCISNRFSKHHANLQSKLKSYIPSKLRPICSQARETRGTCKSTKKSNIVNPSYYIVFILIEKIPTDMPMMKSDNIPHWGKLSVLWDSCYILKHQLANIWWRETLASEVNYVVLICDGLEYILIRSHRS